MRLSGGMATILVIDDERGIREGLSRALTAHGHTARAVGTLTEARAALSETALRGVSEAWGI